MFNILLVVSVTINLLIIICLREIKKRKITGFLLMVGLLLCGISFLMYIFIAIYLGLLGLGNN